MEKIIAITRKEKGRTDFLYWQTKTPKERIEALEFLRKQFMVSNHVDERLQRVYRIVRQKQG